MGLGVFLGFAVPQFNVAINAWSAGTISVPLAAGLILMMYDRETAVGRAADRRAAADPATDAPIVNGERGETCQGHP